MTVIELHTEKLNLIEEILYLDANDVIKVKKLVAKLLSYGVASEI